MPTTVTLERTLLRQLMEAANRYIDIVTELNTKSERLFSAYDAQLQRLITENLQLQAQIDQLTRQNAALRGDPQ